MVGNNSSGSRSIVYGESKDKVLRVSGVLAGGEAAAFGGCAGGDLAAGIGGPAGERLAAALAQVREQYREPIAGDYPRTRRCTSGYNLRELLTPEPNLGRLLAGSEGTLALFTELEVLLDPRPARRVGAAFTFTTLHAALDANVAILETGPSAVEFLDLEPLRRAPNLAQYRSLAALLDGTDAALLTVEYQGSEEEALAGLARLRALAGCTRGSADRSGSRSPRRSPRRRRFAAPSCRCSWERRGRSARRRSSRTPRWRRSGSRASSPTCRGSSRPTAPAPASRVTRPPGVCTSGRCSTSRRRPAWRAWNSSPPRSAAWSPTITARSRGSTAAAAPAAGSCRSSSARVCTRPWSWSRTCSTLAGCSTPASSSAVRRSASHFASVPTIAATAAGRRACPTPPRAASGRRSRSASARACARSSPAPCVRPAPRLGTRRAPRGRAPTRCRASCAAPYLWRRSARASSGTCSAPASPARRARRSAPPASTWRRSRWSGWRSSARARACPCLRAASATSAGWPRWPRRWRRW